MLNLMDPFLSLSTILSNATASDGLIEPPSFSKICSVQNNFIVLSLHIDFQH